MSAARQVHPTPRAGSVRFDAFAFDPQSGDLFHHGKAVHLPPRPLAILRLLIENPGSTVTRQQLREQVWPEDHYLEFDQSLNSSIRRLRAALGDSPKQPLFIETVPRRGYRWIGQRIDGSREKPSVPFEGAGEGPAATPTAEAVSWIPLALCFFILVIAAAVPRWLPTPKVSTPDSLTVVLLPFEGAVNLDSPELDSLEPQLTENLGRLFDRRLRSLDPQRLRLLGNATATAIAERSPGAEALVSSLDYSIEGIVSSTADRVRVELSLSTPTGPATWQGHRQWPRTAPIDQIDSALAELAHELGGTLLGRQGRRDDRELPNAAALEAVVRGRYQQKLGDSENLQLALASYSRAIELDPEYAQAWALKAKLLTQLGWSRSGSPIPATLAEAAQAADRALRLDSEQVEALLASSWIELYYNWDFERATAAINRALQVSPTIADTHSANASLLAARGDTAAAVDAARAAQELDPLNFSVRSDLCWYLLYDRRFDEATENCKTALELEPTNRWIRLALAVGQRRVDPAAALASWFELLEGSSAPVQEWQESTSPSAETLRQVLNWFAGQQLAAFEAQQAQRLAVASAYAAAGDASTALDWLEQAISARDAFAIFANVDPRFEELRQLPRFSALTAQIGPLA